MEGGAPPTTWEEYLQALDRPGRWCDDLTFRAMTKRLNCRILLIVGDIAAPDQVIAYGKRISYKDDRRQVVVPVLHKDRHYQLIAPKAGKELPREWLELEAGGHPRPVPRGGGWLPSRCSSQSSKSRARSRPAPSPRAASSRASSKAGGGDAGGWLPSSASSSTSRSKPAPALRATSVRASSGAGDGDAGGWLPSRASSSTSRLPSDAVGNAWLPSRASSSARAPASKTARTMATGGASLVPPPPPPPEVGPSRDNGDKLGWYCELCKKFVCEGRALGGHDSRLTVAKHNHITRVHPGVPRSMFRRLNAQVIVKPKPIAQLATPFWKCAWCSVGLPKLEPNVHIASVNMHLRHCAKAPKKATSGGSAKAQAIALGLPGISAYKASWGSQLTRPAARR